MPLEAVLAEFRAAGALLEGHFVLTSGRHSPVYMQCARVMMDPRRGERLVGALAVRLRPYAVDLVVAPAMGGVVVGYELARQLGRPSIFAERVEGRFTLRRGFDIPDGARIVVAEDVVTTGLSARECADLCRAYGGKVVAAACLIDRSNGRAGLDMPLVSLAEVELPTYAPDAVPPELAAIPAVKPGSRGLERGPREQG
ncbi:MAG: orotate phosphoribosyltransferase [Geminicoccaceae bacterium]|nr:orotate phosphoribosyltransferase [Geminicoccaceae bacterium]